MVSETRTRQEKVAVLTHSEEFRIPRVRTFSNPMRAREARSRWVVHDTGLVLGRIFGNTSSRFVTECAWVCCLSTNATSQRTSKHLVLRCWHCEMQILVRAFDTSFRFSSAEWRGIARAQLVLLHQASMGGPFAPPACTNDHIP